MNETEKHLTIRPGAFSIRGDPLCKVLPQIHGCVVTAVLITTSQSVMNHLLLRIGSGIGARFLGHGLGDVARNGSQLTAPQMCRFRPASSSSTLPVTSGTGMALLHPRLWVQIVLPALICVLLLGRGTVVGNPETSPATDSADLSGQVSTPYRVVYNPFLGPVRLGSRNILRSGRCRHAFLPTFGWDDPNDDETSDDPTDDNDGWEGLNAFGEPNVPISALFQSDGCFRSELETRSESLGYESRLHTSFLGLQRLRC